MIDAGRGRAQVERPAGRGQLPGAAVAANRIPRPAQAFEAAWR